MDELDGMEQEAEQFTATHLELEFLNKRAELSARVLIDLGKQGPVYQFMLAKRDMAMEALDALLAADPRDAAEVALQQTRVLGFIHDSRWIRGIVEDGKLADSEIIERWGLRDERRESERQD